MATPCGRGLLPIEADPANSRMRGEEGGKVIDTHGVPLDRGVETPRPDAALEHVPDRDASFLQRGFATRVRRRRLESENRAGDAPELVVTVGVVLVGRERSLSWHAAENEDAGPAVGERREAADSLAKGTHPFILAEATVNLPEGTVPFNYVRTMAAM